MPVIGAAVKIVVSEWWRAKGRCSVLQYVVDKQTSAVPYGGKTKKKSSLGTHIAVGTLTRW